MGTHIGGCEQFCSFEIQQVDGIIPNGSGNARFLAWRLAVSIVILGLQFYGIEWLDLQGIVVWAWNELLLLSGKEVNEEDRRAFRPILCNLPKMLVKEIGAWNWLPSCSYFWFLPLDRCSSYQHEASGNHKWFGSVVKYKYIWAHTYKMRRRAADFRRPVRRRFSRGSWAALGGFFFILFVLLFGHERQPSPDVFHHEVRCFCYVVFFWHGVALGLGL